MKIKFITWTVLSLFVAGTLGAQDLKLKEEASDSIVITTAAVLGALGTAAAAAGTAAIGAVASGVVGGAMNLIGKIFSKGAEPAAVKAAIAEEVKKELVNEAALGNIPVAAATAGNSLNNDSLNFSSEASHMAIPGMIKSSVVRPSENPIEDSLIASGVVPADVAKRVAEKVHAKLKAAAGE